MTEIAYTRHPTAAEAAAGITAETLGVHALPQTATPAQRAHAEAVRHPAAGPDQPCRCCGTHCQHAAPCTIDGCDGRLLHRDRYPGSMFCITEWADHYQCTHCNDGGFLATIELPNLPWGEVTTHGDAKSIVIYEGVRHPNFGNSGGTLGGGA